MNSGYIEYKTVIFIEDVLQTQLVKQKKRLLECQKDKNCNMEIYENQLDFCNKLEYAIKEMEKFKT
tara:strand:- start:978 stop:1175 length:198 start_codon:yes stop_codon:yes gene_type:complete